MKYKDLSINQRIAYQKIMEFLVNGTSSFYILNGYAGTGKSSIISAINNTLVSNRFDRVANIAFTGKAASVLSSKGITATTIHKFMYTPIYNEYDEIVDFKRKENDIILNSTDVIIVDESSMVPKDVFLDLLGYGLPILFVGDVNQLPPIGDDFNIMDHPDDTITEIHRQNIDNPIIKLANGIRETGRIDKSFIDGNAIKSINKNDINKKFLEFNEFDIILCGTNKTREKINGLIRRTRGYVEDHAEIGERLICLKNNHFNETMNGEIFTVEGISSFNDYKKYYFNNKFINIHNGNWYGMEPENSELNYGQFDFAYCITVHKSQGSEFNNVLFIDEDVSRFCDRRRFRYTAITRASKSITIAS